VHALIVVEFWQINFEVGLPNPVGRSAIESDVTFKVKGSPKYPLSHASFERTAVCPRGLIMKPKLKAEGDNSTHGIVCAVGFLDIKEIAGFDKKTLDC
jgi:hypothetical protein